jgi:hypothetical protein
VEGREGVPAEMHEILRAIGQCTNLSAADGRPRRVKPHRHEKGLTVLEPQQPSIGWRLLFRAAFGHRGSGLFSDRRHDVFRTFRRIAERLTLDITIDGLM